MDLEKAFNKIDNFCCSNHNTLQGNKVRYLNDREETINMFQDYKETNDDDFCKDVNEMCEALDTIKEVVDLQKQLGCPLDFIFKVLQAPKIYIEGMNVRGEYDDRFKFHSTPNNYIINPYAIEGKKPEFLFVDRWIYGYDLRLKDYKKTWWLKEDKSE